MLLNDSKFVQDIVTMENIAHSGKLTREKFVKLHGEDFALAAERFVKNPFPKSQRLSKQLTAQERFSDSLISHIS